MFMCDATIASVIVKLWNSGQMLDGYFKELTTRSLWILFLNCKIKDSSFTKIL